MWRQIQENKRKSVVLVIGMGFFLLGIGFAVGELFLGYYAGAPAATGLLGMGIAAVLWLVLAITSMTSGDKIMLSASGARPVTQDEFPKIFNVVEEMKIAAGLPVMPKIFIIDDPSLNAFATGLSPKNCAVAVTSGLVSQCTRDELQGVIAHEISHIVNRDVMFMTQMGVMLGAIVLMAEFFRHSLWYGGMGRSRSSRRSSGGGGGNAQIVILVVSILFMILAPIAANIIYFATSRRREYLADACAARYTRYPEGLASALNKIASRSVLSRKVSQVTAPMYIENPAAHQKRQAASLFSTHPPIEERIKILMGMGGEFSFTEYQRQWQKIKGPKNPLFNDQDLTSKFYAATPAAVPGRATAAAEAPSPAQRPAEAAAPVAHKTQLNDFFWGQNGYAFINCSCGARIKIPPKFHADSFYCPRCRRKHATPVNN